MKGSMYSYPLLLLSAFSLVSSFVTTQRSIKIHTNQHKFLLFAINDNDDTTTDSDNLREYFATCIPGLAPILSDELISLGATNVEQSGTSGVRFCNDPSSKVDIGMKAILWVRTAHRIMELVTTTEDHDDWDIEDRDGLYEFIQSTTPLQSLLGDGQGGLLTLSVSTTLNGQVPKELCHSHYTGLTVKNALVDLVRSKREDGIRPDVDTVDADVPLLLVLRGNRERRGCQATLFRILHSGGSLHKRGYRIATVHKAAMKESLAAGLLMEAGYHKLIEAAKNDGQPAVLVDPMAGSGTFCLEAALIAADHAPGLIRMKYYEGESSRNPHQAPPVARWKGSDRAQWKEMVLEARERAATGLEWIRAKDSNCVIMGNEFNPSAASLALANIEKAGFSDFISINEGDCINWDLGGEEDDDSPAKIVVPGRAIVVCNPPWGLRLNEDIEESWLSLKSFLREQCNSAEAWVLSGNKETTRYLRMKKSRSVVIKTADEDLRWIQYHVFRKKTTDAPMQSQEQPTSQVGDGFS
jgi:23S rRNA G2445 N2-methylase RlmL